MIGYLIASCCISFLGYLLYILFAKNRISIKQSRILLYTIVIASIGSLVGMHFALDRPEIVNSNYYVSALTNNQDCSEEDIIAECESIQAECGFCSCDHIKEQNIVAYKASTFYDFMLFNKEKAKKGLLICISIFSGLFLIRLFYLIYLINVGRKEEYWIDGVKCYLLNSGNNVAVGSFKLIHNYIIWSPALDDLDKEELHAVMLHEVSHLKQLNTYELILMNLVQVLWFVNPVFYFLKKELVDLSEFMADEFVLTKVESKKWYANLLLKVKSGQSFSLSSNFNKSNLRTRIERIIEKPKHSFGRFVLVWFAVVLVICSSSAISATVIESNSKDLNVYENIKQRHAHTGREYYCKHCVLCCDEDGAYYEEELELGEE